MFQYLSNLIASNLPFKMTKFASLFFAAAIILFACKRETDFLGDKQLTKAPLSEKVQSTKGFFNEYAKVIAPYSPFKNIKPLWDYAVSTDNFVEVSFTIDGKLTIPSIYKGLTYLGKQRLLIYNVANQEKVCYIMNIMPDATFSGNVKEINTINLKNKKFSGIIALYHLSGGNIAAYRFEQGIVVGKLTQKNGANNGIELRGCAWVTYQYACGHTEIDGRSSEPQCSEYEQYDCWYDDNGSGALPTCPGMPWCDDFVDPMGGNVGGSSYVPTPVSAMCPGSIKAGLVEGNLSRTVGIHLKHLLLVNLLL